MSNILNMVAVNAAMDAALATDNADGKIAATALALKPYVDRIAELKAEGGDTRPERVSAFVDVAVGWFIGLRHAKKDKTFKKGLSAGALALVTEKAALIPEKEGDGLAERKSAANAHFNPEQLATWKDVSKAVLRVFKKAGIETPNPRAKRGAAGATDQAESAEGAESTPAVAPAKVAFAPETVTPAHVETALETVAALLNIGAFEARQFNAAQQAGAVAGDYGAAILAFHEAVTGATRALREAADKAERAAAIAAASAKAATAKEAENAAKVAANKAAAKARKAEAARLQKANGTKAK